jgi:hypothetical protein
MNHQERKYLAENSATSHSDVALEPEEKKVFSRWLSILHDSGVPFIVAGAFAFNEYTCVWRFTKDLDIFLKPESVKAALDALSMAGFETEIRDRHWLAKTTRDGYLLDLIFSLGNGYIPIDDTWFESGHTAVIAGVTTQLVGIEELIASKVYVTRSDRFDAADILHIIRAAKGELKWDRLLQILKEDDILLLWYLLLFNYVYPGHADYLPQDLMGTLWEKVRKGWSSPRDPKSFYGMMVDPLRFKVDVNDWEYRDERKQGGPLIDEKGNRI